MGRGRAKAKQTKVARELKYRNNAIDVGALRAELSGNGHSSSSATTTSEVDLVPDEDEDEPYSGHYEVPSDDDDEWAPVRRRN